MVLLLLLVVASSFVVSFFDGVSFSVDEEVAASVLSLVLVESLVGSGVAAVVVDAAVASSSFVFVSSTGALSVWLSVLVVSLFASLVVEVLTSSAAATLSLLVVVAVEEGLELEVFESLMVLSLPSDDAVPTAGAFWFPSFLTLLRAMACYNQKATFVLWQRR